MYLSILILPFLASFVSGLMGRKLGNTGSHIITCGSLFLASILSTIGFFEVALSGSPVYINLGSWVDSGFLNIIWELSIDQLSISLGTVVLICSTLIHLFSTDYMSEDPHQPRFFSYLSLFTGFMLVLVYAANYFVLFVGWEGIGIVSYLLINFWYTRVQANKSAMLALNMNRLGDMGLSIGLFTLFGLFGSLDYATVFSSVPFLNEYLITLIVILLFIASAAKSANIPLHSWLPGSMEGPTPVSSLIHAATLVTAGVYLLLRSSPILEYSATGLLVITVVGTTTAFVAALCGLVQNDAKRIIAFSTISQLGYMIMAVGLSQYNVAIFHVLNHAFIKALLFLGSGAVIHSFADNQDIRKMGGLINFLPFVYSVFITGTLSLLATPWLTGFYSKDLILELAYSQYNFNGTYAFILGSVTAGLTAFYSFRLISLVFLTVPNGSKTVYLNSHESNLAVIIPLFVLGIFSIFFGYIFSDSFVGIGSDFFGNSLFIHPNNITLTEAEFSLSTTVKLIPAILSLTGAAFALFIYHRVPNFSNVLSENTIFGKVSRKLYTFLNGKFFFDVIYNKYFIEKGFILGYLISKILDRGFIEMIGPYGISSALTKTGVNISKLDTGIISTYAVYIIISFAILIFLTFAY